jgi:hypothetical protein
VPDTPDTRPVNLLEVSTRAEHARHIINGFSITAPTLADLLRQVNGALADIPILSAEVLRLHAQLTASRMDRANLAAAGRITIAAYLDGEDDPLGYLRDELHAQGFGAGTTYDRASQDAPSCAQAAPLRPPADGRYQTR